jgi:hypothetical protein
MDNYVEMFLVTLKRMLSNMKFSPNSLFLSNDLAMKLHV